MNKQEFISQLKIRLSGFSKESIEEQLSFYSEIIDDKIEDGFDEEEAVSSIGSIDSILKNLIDETSFIKIAKEKIKPKRKLSTLEIILLIIGSPLWISVLIAVIAVIFSFYISLWSIIISFWSVFVSFFASSLGMLTGGVIVLFKGKLIVGTAMIGICFILVGLSILTFYSCKYLTKAIILLTKKITVSLKKYLIKKGSV